VIRITNKNTDQNPQKSRELYPTRRVTLQTQIFTREIIEIDITTIGMFNKKD
jgi:hypothetical protein